MRILIVEDNDIVADAIVRSLTKARFVVDRVAHAESAQAALAAERFDLAVIDIGLPGVDGLTLVRRLRSAGNRLPALILTARDSVNDKVQALDLGADDFLSKPFEPAELVARCHALIRRAGAALTGTITLGRLTLDLVGKQLRIDGQEIQLTSREWLVLECLTRHLGRVVSKDHVLQAITNLEDSITPNAVEAHISRLRSKLGDAAVIRGLRGLGYRLEEPKTP
jgi:two-component system, OmpR family, response regulator